MITILLLTIYLVVLQDIFGAKTVVLSIYITHSLDRVQLRDQKSLNCIGLRFKNRILNLKKKYRVYYQKKFPFLIFSTKLIFELEEHTSYRESKHARNGRSTTDRFNK